ncbi:MAG: ATP synthase F1 subunit epsilon [Proteobacteria bacterium]|nr:ATP synthase F1 subunit epsilon [Pseudomonadota bacterium]
MDAAGKVAFELASPEALLVSTSVDMVVVPGVEGDFGVLPGHAPFISAVRPGVIDIYQGEKIERRLFVSDGFAEVNERRCTVLSSEAYPLEELEREEVVERLRESEDELRDADSDDEREAAEKDIAICEAMLAALG